MANFDRSFKTNIALLKKEVGYITDNSMFFRPFIGDLAYTQDPNSGKSGMDTIPTGSIVEMVNFMPEEGRDNMLVPFVKPLSEEGSYGDSKLIGTGETAVYQWLRVYINANEKVVRPREGVMSNFRAKSVDNDAIMLNLLKDFIIKMKNANFASAIYEGASVNITAGTADNGYGLYKRLHPNMQYCSATTGTIAAIGTDGKTKTTSEMTTVFSTATNIKKLTLAHLDNFAAYCRDKNIEQMVTQNGASFWILVVHSKQYQQLRQDTTFLANQRSYQDAVGTYNDPLFTRAKTFCGEFAIFVDDTVVRSYAYATTTFGDYKTKVATTSTNVGAICLGRGALGYAYPMTTDIRAEVTEFDTIKEVAGIWIDGVARRESFSATDESSVFTLGQSTAAWLGTAYTAINQSSAILFSGEATS